MTGKAKAKAEERVIAPGTGRGTSVKKGRSTPAKKVPGTSAKKLRGTYEKKKGSASRRVESLAKKPGAERVKREAGSSARKAGAAK